jgi:RNA polymerase sigma-70 factor (ECF subfamily)
MDKSELSGNTPRNTDATSLTLLERVKSRDSAAWQRLVELYGPLVFSWCRRSGLPAEDCQDVIQEIFAAVAANLGRFRRERPGDTFRGWVRVIARNQIRLHFRRQAHRPKAVGGTTAQIRIQELPAEPFDELDDASDACEHHRLMCRGVELIRCEFEEHTWQAFWLTAVEQRSSAEVCQQLQMTSGAVRQARYKVLRRLRTELGDLLEQGPWTMG